MPPSIAARVSSPASPTAGASDRPAAAAPGKGFRLRVPMGRAIVLLLLLAVLATATPVHFLWRHTAGLNVDGAVSSLEAGSAAAVGRELAATFAAAEANAEIVRSVLFQGAIRADDEAKREFLFLSLLRTHRLFGWIGFGFPDGRFFGARAASDGGIEMVEIGPGAPGAPKPLRRDLYRPIPGDIFFLERLKGETEYVTLGSPWYRAGANAGAPAWTMADVLPGGFEPSLVAAKRVDVYGAFAGVVMVAIPLERLSGELAALDFARQGEVFVIGGDGAVLASSRVGEGARAARLDDFPPEDRLAAAVARFVGGVASGEARAIVADPVAGAVHVSMSPLPFNGWRLLTAVPRSAFTGEIDRNTRRVAIAVFALVAGSILVAVLFAHFLFARPMRAISTELRKIERFSLQSVVASPTFLAELDDFSAALKRMAVGLASFTRYMPLDVVRPLVEMGIEPRPGGTMTEITVMFADLPGFTDLAERLGPDVEPYLTQFLTIAVEAVHREGGTVDKFIGDAVMAIWNAPAEIGDHAARACRAAIAIRDAMPPSVAYPGAPRVRIGINTGVALVGNVGSAERLSYTAIGDTVNLASRLVGVAKEFDVEIVLGEATRSAAGARFDTNPLGRTAIRGKRTEVGVFELVRGVAEACD